MFYGDLVYKFRNIVGNTAFFGTTENIVNRVKNAETYSTIVFILKHTFKYDSHNQDDSISIIIN